MKEEAPPWKMAVPMDTREYLKGVQLNDFFYSSVEIVCKGDKCVKEKKIVDFWGKMSSEQQARLLFAENNLYF